jgi:hypothetical protein
VSGADPPERARPKRTYRPVHERLEAAKRAEEKAAARLARKALKVRKYEAVQRSQERKLDTRRKIIAGALALEHILHDATYGRMFVHLLNTYVVSDRDRALFGLPPLPPDPLEAEDGG